MRSFGLILRDAEVDALQNGTFEVHCLTIRLECGTGDDAVAYAGPGSIRRTPDGRTHVRLYAQDQYDPDPARQILRGHRFVPESAYFRLTATDRAGRQWRCDHVLLPGWAPPGAGGSVIEARLRRLTAQQDLGDTPFTDFGSPVTREARAASPTPGTAAPRAGGGESGRSRRRA